MNFERKFLEDQLDLGGINLEQSFQFGDGQNAIGALKIGEFDDSDSRIGRTSDGRSGDGHFDGVVQNFARMLGAVARGLRGENRLVGGFAVFDGLNDGGGQAGAIGTRGVFHAALGHFHAAATGTSLFAENFEHSRFLLDVEAGEIDAGKRGGGFPILREQHAGGEQARRRDDPEAPRQKGHSPIVRALRRGANTPFARSVRAGFHTAGDRRLLALGEAARQRFRCRWWAKAAHGAAPPSLATLISLSLLLELKDVYVERGGRYALRGLTLDIQGGEHVAILGPNGSGKSTLIKTITRECYPLLRPETRLRILGAESWNIFDLRHHLGVVSNDLMAQCTRDIRGRELVLSGFFGSIGIWPNHQVLPEMEAAAAKAMARLEVTHLADRWLDELSSGEARRLLIARALIHNPDTLLLDEPTTSLDLPSLREVRQQLRNLAQSGVGLLLVTHHLDDIIPEIDRVILLKEGTVFLDGAKSEVLTSESLSAIFGVAVEVVEREGFFHAW